MNEITTVGVDIAKEVIVVCAADAQGRPIYFKQFSFSSFAEWAANLPPCLIAMRRAARRITGPDISADTVTRRN